VTTSVPTEPVKPVKYYGLASVRAGIRINADQQKESGRHAPAAPSPERADIVDVLYRFHERFPERAREISAKSGA
jgi:hypothetical protein